jgi:phage baseplate assembly protein W
VLSRNSPIDRPVSSSPAPIGEFRLSDFLGRGLRFPIQPDSRGRLGRSSDEQKIEESIWLILSTAPGERVMMPGFGCGLQELVFEPNSPLVESAVAIEVQQALVRWEPRIDVIDVQVDAPEPNLMLIRVDYRVRAANTVHNLVYPFSVSEGGVPVGGAG